VRIILLGGCEGRRIVHHGGHTEEMPHNFNTDKLFLGMAGIFAGIRADRLQPQRNPSQAAGDSVRQEGHCPGRPYHTQTGDPVKVANLTAAHQIVTDDGLPEADRRLLEGLGSRFSSPAAREARGC